MSEQQNGLTAPFLVNNLVTRTQRLDSAGSTRSLNSPLDTFRQTQERYKKETNGSGILAGDDEEKFDTEEGDDGQNEVEPRISISESCIFSESDSEGEDNNNSFLSVSNDEKSQSNVSIGHSIKPPTYENAFVSHSSAHNTLDEETSDEESAIMKDSSEAEEEGEDVFDYNIEEDEGRLPSAGNYLSSLKGSASTVSRTTSISKTKRPTVESIKDNMDYNILARASPIHKYKQRSKSFNSGLIHKNRRTSSTTSSHPNNSPTETNMLLKQHSNSSYQNIHKTSWSLDAAGVPLLLLNTQTLIFISQYIHKYPSYMKNNSLENLEHIHNESTILNREFDTEEYIRFMNYPTLKLLDMMSCLLTKIIQTNDDLAHSTEQNNDFSGNKEASNANKTLLFRGQNIPHFPINKYLQRAHQYCATSNDVYLSLLVYFDRLSQPTVDDMEPKLILDSYNIHRLIITAFTVATKFSQDVYFTNKRYAKVGGISDRELNKLELAFLDLLKWEKLRCSGVELLKYWNLLNGFWERESENHKDTPHLDNKGNNS